MNRARLGLLTGTHAINDLYQGLVPALLPFMVLERGYTYGSQRPDAGGHGPVEHGPAAVRPVCRPVATALDGAGRLCGGRPGPGPGGHEPGLLGQLVGCRAVRPGDRGLPSVRNGGGPHGGRQLAEGDERVFGGRNGGASFAPMLAAAVVGAGALHRSWMLALPAAAMLVLWYACTWRDGAKDHCATRRPAVAQGELPANHWRAFFLLCGVIVCWSIPM